MKNPAMNLKSKTKQSPVVVSVLISAGICLIIIALRTIRGLEFLELAAYDHYLCRQPKVCSPNPPVALITISEADIQKQGCWPLPDGTIAELLKTLLNYQPRAIGLDIYRDIPVPPGSEQLADIFSGHDNIVTVNKIGDETSLGVSSPYMVNSTNLVGFNDILVDRGGVVRRGLLFLDDGETSFYSFALLLAMLYLEEEDILPQAGLSNPQHLRLGKTTFVPFKSHDGGYIKADDRGYQFLLDYKNKLGAFQNFSLTHVLSGQLSPNPFQDKIVIIGVTAESLKDFFFTPLSKNSESINKMSGAELHAQIVSQIIRSALEGGKHKKSMNEWYEWGWILMWSLIGGLMVLWRRSFLHFLLLTIAGLLALGFISYFIFNLGWWVPLVPPALALLISASLVTAHMSYQEKVQRAILMQLFSKHVSKNVAESIWQQRDQFMDGGRPRTQKLTATVLFTDLKGFTTISENLSPQALMDWLNNYMEAMAQIVIDHGGVINKYIGDAVMAVFGIPLPRVDEAEIRRDAENAVSCALSMAEEIKGLNSLWQKQNLPTAKMRIGIFTGPLVAGCIGSSHRMEYTVIGDTVNIASRLEGFNKDSVDPSLTNHACRILIGGKTLHLLGRKFQTEMVGKVNLKGKDKKITIYRVTGRVDQSNDNSNNTDFQI